MTHRPRPEIHKIVDVRFAQTAEQGRPSSEAPLLCSCSEVVTSGTWEAHRGPASTALAKRERRMPA